MYGPRPGRNSLLDRPIDVVSHSHEIDFGSTQLLAESEIMFNNAARIISFSNNIDWAQKGKDTSDHAWTRREHCSSKMACVTSSPVAHMPLLPACIAHNARLVTRVVATEGPHRTYPSLGAPAEDVYLKNSPWNGCVLRAHA
jgi:hypothetical protein